MISFVKKHKGLIIFLIIFVILGVLLFQFARSILMVENEGTLYGNRLEGIEKVKLNEDTLDKIVSDMKKNEQVKSAKHRLEGRLLNFSLNVKGGTSQEAIISLVGSIKEALTEKEQAFYDIQVIVTCSEEKESELYPMIGYKHKTSSDFVW